MIKRIYFRTNLDDIPLSQLPELNTVPEKGTYFIIPYYGKNILLEVCSIQYKINYRNERDIYATGDESAYIQKVDGWMVEVELHIPKYSSMSIKDWEDYLKRLREKD
jgi:hypothetical protein